VDLDRLAQLLCHSRFDASGLGHLDALTHERPRPCLIGRVETDRPQSWILHLQLAYDRVAPRHVAETGAVDVERENACHLLPDHRWIGVTYHLTAQDVTLFL